LFRVREKEVATGGNNSSSKAPGKGQKSGKWVTVRAGDTLGAIARRNHTSVASLKKLNKMRGSTIRAGQRIRVR
jgi:membrane-bound lytic murein transglycosylase D